jgi:hypothetical protein
MEGTGRTGGSYVTTLRHGLLRTVARSRPAMGDVRRRSGRLKLAVTLCLIVAAASLTACGEASVPDPAAQIDQAKNAAAKTQILAIETGIRAYQAMSGQLPPDASQATLGQFVDPWPKNPWTGAPMRPGSGKGDYTYAQTNDGFRLTVHLDGGD